MIRALRTLIALPLFLISAVTLVAMVWNFATGTILAHAGDFVVGGMYFVITVVLLFLVAVINPKPKPTMPKLKTFTIPADPAKAVTRSTIDEGLAALQAAVGGYIEPVGSGKGWTAWADEDGKYKNKPFNSRATHAMAFMAGHNIGDPIVGDVVITGNTDDGEPADLADDVAVQAESLTREIAPNP